MSFLKKVATARDMSPSVGPAVENKILTWIFDNMGDEVKQELEGAAKKIVEKAKTKLPPDLLKSGKTVDWKKVEDYIKKGA